MALDHYCLWCLLYMLVKSFSGKYSILSEWILLILQYQNQGIWYLVSQSPRHCCLIPLSRASYLAGYWSLPCFFVVISGLAFAFVWSSRLTWSDSSSHILWISFHMQGTVSATVALFCKAYSVLPISSHYFLSKTFSYLLYCLTPPFVLPMPPPSRPTLVPADCPTHLYLSRLLTPFIFLIWWFLNLGYLLIAFSTFCHTLCIFSLQL